MSLSGTVKEGPQLPYEVSSHCLVLLDDNRAMILGGQSKDDRSFLYDLKNNAWAKGPDIHRMSGSSCGIAKDSITGDIVVFGAGGLGSDKIQYWVDGNKAWNDLPQVYGIISGSSGVSGDDGSFYLIGGVDSSFIFKFSCSNKHCWKTKLSQKIPRSDFVAMLVPDNFC